MATYYVETVRLPFSGPKNCVKVDFNVHKEQDFSVDVLSPSMTAVFRVEHVRNATEAVSCVLEHAAGFATCVQLVFGGRKAEQKERIREACNILTARLHGNQEASIERARDLLAKVS